MDTPLEEKFFNDLQQIINDPASEKLKYLKTIIDDIIKNTPKFQNLLLEENELITPSDSPLFENLIKLFKEHVTIKEIEEYIQDEGLNLNNIDNDKKAAIISIILNLSIAIIIYMIKKIMALNKLSDIQNYTPHLCKISYALFANECVETFAIFPSKGNVRLTSIQEKIGEIEGVPIVTPQKFTGIEGLPDDKTKPIMVSSIVGEYIAMHPEYYQGPVYSPDTSPESVIRDSEGKIEAVKRLIKYK